MNEETFEMLEWGRIVERLTTHCSTDAGAHKASSLRVNSEIDIIKSLLEENGEMRRLISEDRPIVIDSLPLIADDLDSAKAGSTLSARTIASVLKGVRTTERVRRYFKERKGKYRHLLRVAKKIHDLSGLRKSLEEKIDEGGEIKDSASPLMGPLRKRVESARERVVKTANEIMAGKRYKTLIQDRYVTVRNGRHVLPFMTSAKGRVKGILHETSKSGSTIYFEPEELVHANNELKSAESDLNSEKERILAEISMLLGEMGPQISDSIDLTARIDLISARALLAKEMNASEPQVSGGTELELINACHPLLLLAGKDAVPNSISIGGKTQCLVITGPNAGGKTVLIKTTGLLTLMAMAGLSIPASPDSRVVVFKSIYIAMGDQQSVEADLSTFSADILRLNSFHRDGDEKSLILLDEVITGTDPREGTALGRAYLRALVEKGVTVLVTTHYDEIKYMPFEDDRFKVATMGFSEEDFSPTFRLTMGIPGRSMGIKIAEKIGFPGEIIEDARKMIGEGEGRMEKLIDELTALRDREANLLASLSIERKRLAGSEEKLRKETRKIKEREEIILEDARVKSMKLIRDAEEKVEKVLAELKREKRPEIVRKAKDVMYRIKREASTDTLPPEVERVISATKPVKKGEKLPPGQRVFVVSLGREGHVESHTKEKVTISLGTVKSVTRISDIRVYPGKKREFVAERGHGDRPGSAGSHPPHRGEDNTLDLRGLSSEEAVSEVDSYLDRASLREVQFVFLIHGHGTGILKKSLREHLKISPYVEDFEPAPKGQGGDGTTVVKLK